MRLLPSLGFAVHNCMAISLLSAVLSSQVSGVVLDSKSKKPVPGAYVTLQATKHRVTTDAKGAFLLPGLQGKGLVVVAAKKGYYNGPVTVNAPISSLTIMMEPVVVTKDKNYSFASPNTCGICHPDQQAQWAGSPMNQAGGNRWVYDIYNGTGTSGGTGGFVYTRDSVHRIKNPNSECASCHQPEPWIKAPGKALDPIGNLSQGSLHGISCEVCHKIANLDSTKPNFPGIWPKVVDFLLPQTGPGFHQTQFGPLGDSSFVSTLDMRASFQPQLKAEMCAACHQDKNDPDGNGNFEEPNGVISEPTYLEWVKSPYGNPSSPKYQTCAGCHMKPYGAKYVAIRGNPPVRASDQIRSHKILGTTPEYLENAVTMKLSTSIVGNSLRAQVKITNDQTGHHVPTGVTIRNMILLVEAWEVGNGKRLVHQGQQTIHALGGKGDPLQGYYAGLPGKLYAKVNKDANGNGPTFFTDAVGLQFDTRIPALATDTTHYDFKIPSGAGTLRVRARLIYRRSFRFLTDAKKWTRTGHGAVLEDLQAPVFGHLMEEAEWTSAGPGPVQSFGKSCAGLKAFADGRPVSGGKGFSIQLSGAPKGGLALLMLGLSNQNWGTIKLPVDLGPFGGPGCFFLVSLDASAPALANAKGEVKVPLLLPHPLVLGKTFYFQYLTLFPGNRLGLGFSNGLKVTVQR
ncbi:MAG TPA: carboxypeptidase regulatory-like domain-containing protein [Planctomycetes bacterium]|nr:carboxypeptidase regulatory-like domain-containing protein [Planctomycetota bacterium]